MYAYQYDKADRSCTQGLIGKVLQVSLFPAQIITVVYVGINMVAMVPLIVAGDIYSKKESIESAAYIVVNYSYSKFGSMGCSSTGRLGRT